MTYLESPFSQLSDELWHVFGGRRRFPTTRDAPAPGATVTTEPRVFRESDLQLRVSHRIVQLGFTYCQHVVTLEYGSTCT